MKTTVFINPGSGAVKDGSREQSEINIQQFIEDVGVKNVKWNFIKVQDCGRHTYEISKGKRKHEIDMPAIPLDKVRYLGTADQNIWNFPRLYVDGSSWVWKYAIGVCFNKD